MNRIIGIDLGTTNSLVAAVEAGIPLVLADREGKRLTPSVVHLPAAGEPIVGHPALRQRVLQPAQTIYSIKRFIGRRYTDLAPEELKVNYPLKQRADGYVGLDVSNSRCTPEEVSAEILRKLKSDAEAALGEPISRAVITVPAYFNDAQRQATKRAGELAGFTVERILNEPTAAALAYGLDKLEEHSKIAVYDLGGGTFDLSILELSGGIFQVLATNGNTRLGGDDLDQRLIDFFRESIQSAGGPDIYSDRSLLGRVRDAAEETKIKLSSVTDCKITLPFLTPDFNFHCHLSRQQLEELTRDIILRTRSHCLQAMTDAKLSPADLAQVILVGGQTRMPLVRRLVSELFQCAEFAEERGNLRLGQDYHRPGAPLLNTSQNPEEAVAIGAAIQAEILAGGFKNLLLLDVTPLSLGLETFGGLMNVIIPRNSTIPVKAGEVFTNAVDNQEKMLIHVLQGERERARDNWSLGRFTIDFPPGPRGSVRVGVQFALDANGILQVLARELKTGKEVNMSLSSSVNVDDAKVQKMVEESVEFAFADLKARRWVEVRLRAEQIAPATRQALLECAEILEPDYRQKVLSAVAAVEAILQSSASAGDSGDPEPLKAAVEVLDKETQQLAEIQMDRVMDTLLRQKGILPGIGE